MAEAFTSYAVANDKLFTDAINRAALTVSNLTIPFTQILQDFYKSEQAIFKLKSPGQYPDFKNGGPESNYAKAKQRAVGFKYPLLVRSGRLAASLLSQSASGAVAQIQPLSLTIGTTIAYGIYHQSDSPRSRIPLRKFLFIGPEATRFATSDQVGRAGRWLNILNDYVLKVLRLQGQTVTKL